jgi:hypothetical protein
VVDRHVVGRGIERTHCARVDFLAFVAAFAMRSGRRGPSSGGEPGAVLTEFHQRGKCDAPLTRCGSLRRARSCTQTNPPAGCFERIHGPPFARCRRHVRFLCTQSQEIGGSTISFGSGRPRIALSARGAVGRVHLILSVSLRSVLIGPWRRIGKAKPVPSENEYGHGGEHTDSTAAYGGKLVRGRSCSGGDSTLPRVRFSSGADSTRSARFSGGGWASVIEGRARRRSSVRADQLHRGHRCPAGPGHLNRQRTRAMRGGRAA